MVRIAKRLRRCGPKQQPECATPVSVSANPATPEAIRIATIALNGGASTKSRRYDVLPGGIDRMIVSMGGTDRPDYYKLLHVQPEAPEEIIKASYRAMMQRLGMHPDLGGDHATAVLLNEAFETLSDPERRAAYDRARTSGGDQSSHAPSGDPAPRRRDTKSDLPFCPFCATAYQPSQPPDPESACTACGAPLAPAQPAMPDEHSRRALDRLPRHMALNLVTSSARHRRLNGITLDLSPAGMRFLTTVHMMAGDRVLIVCTFCSAVGIVRSVHHRAGDPHDWEIGVQFVTLHVKRQKGGLIRTNA